MEIIMTIAQIASCITATAAALALLIRPIRERLFRVKKDNDAERNGLKCLLRSELLKIYYRYRDVEEIPQYEAEHFVQLYEAYKNLGGNSFINEIHDIVITWKVIH